MESEGGRVGRVRIGDGERSMGQQQREGEGLTLLVTVGSTQFAALSDFMVQASTLSALRDLGFAQLTLQHGSHTPTLPAPSALPPRLQPLRYHPDLRALLRQAHVIVSHAGAGTVLEAVEAARPLVVVVNDALLHNHQTELADAMHAAGCCIVVPANQLDRNLIPAIERLLRDDGANRAPPPRVRGVFARIVAEELASSE
ncbi:UDP-N-acetylglucosamine transferase subunit ALG13-like [Gracilariopsis chorda]|uniref:UDP-N-acetylglucosamine transferase subunit ALG13 n=1 Tax=Gracilariopsis chorda TaxID=448386 RepID=A0A2V3IG66_9FLOR|nr:UDP-N-acetylglucosamine transferase subunit ALG13-like [Gracilariopsis chorda]|eukprot:PXF41067.1 UDP-N-acetylglucosamine transferase subunit ALG13-like [Gracilariopsis chorda]